MQQKDGSKQTASPAQMEAVKGVLKEHLEKNKFFDQIKSEMQKNPKTHKLDKNVIIEKLRSEGVLNEIISQLPLHKPKATSGNPGSISDSRGSANS